MCGRFTIYHPVDFVAQQFSADPPAVDVVARYNVAPTESSIIVTNTIAGSGRCVSRNRQLEFSRWGLIPSWAGDMSIGARMINARGEELAEKPAFRKALASRVSMAGIRS
jgi:putative SOS response-associated peptidase YedK